MKRLSKGALAAKITASILASTLFASSCLPVVAADSVDDKAPEVVTLPPLPDTGSAPAASPAPDNKPTLTFTPESGNAAAAGGAAPVPGTQVPRLDPTSDAVPASADSGTPPPVSATSDGSAPAAVSSPTAQAAGGNTPAADNSGRELASTPAPPEVSEAQPVPKQVAQAGTAGRSPIDPLYKKLPPSIGTVKIRRGFDKFPAQTIIHNLSFRDTPVKEVVAELARRGNLNIILDRSAQGRITGDLHDLTLNEAMDTVLSASGLQWRQLDNATLIIGTPNALYGLGLNRVIMRVFKLSYAHPFQVAQLLWATCFNRGWLPDFSTAIRSRSVHSNTENPNTKNYDYLIRGATVPTPGGGTETSKTQNQTQLTLNHMDEEESGVEQNGTTRPDSARAVRGSIREQTNEGTGFNSGAVDPGSETIRSRVSITTDFPVDQNGGGPIAIPDVANSTVIVCGTQDDINIAEEAIRLLDRRPRQVHIQSSLIELNTQGIRQLGAALNLQGAGASGTVLGGSGAPLVSFLPGLGSLQNVLFQGNATLGQVVSNAVAGMAPLPLGFNNVGPYGLAGAQGFAAKLTQTGNQLTVTPGTSQFSTAMPSFPTNGFLGFIGNSLPASGPTIAGVQANNSAQSGFNFLTLNHRAGGKANIATVPAGLNFSLNFVLQTSKAKLLANPSVVVDDNSEALITLANEVVHKVTTTVSLGVVSTNVELVKAGIFLDVLPKISEDGFITLRLRPQVSSPLGGPQEFANGTVIVTLLNVREVLTQEVRVKDGQTLVIGGLFTEQEASELSKVPYLAEAPILGALFRNTIKGRNRTELMLLITPKIVEDEPPNTLGQGGPTL